MLSTIYSWSTSPYLPYTSSPFSSTTMMFNSPLEKNHSPFGFALRHFFSLFIHFLTFSGGLCVSYLGCGLPSNPSIGFLAVSFTTCFYEILATLNIATSDTTDTDNSMTIFVLTFHCHRLHPTLYSRYALL